MGEPLPTKTKLLLLALGLASASPALAGPLAPRRLWQLPDSTLKSQDSTATRLLTSSVIDENGEPLVGVAVTSRRGTLTAVSDAMGTFKLPITKGDTVVLRAFGSVVRHYILRDDTAPLIVLNTKNAAVARLKPVQQLYATTVRPDLTATSTQAVYNNELQKLPVTSFVTALAGRLAGLYTVQGSGQPGADAASPSLLGQAPLVVIDGIPRQLTQFDLEEIESVTVLKDALSTAMLGVRSSNGVLLVTTRKGTPGQPRVSFTVQSALQQPIKMPKALNAYNYALLNNEARRNDGLAPVYTDADLQAYQNGSDPYGHPDVDWRKQTLKSSSRLNRYTFSASGGNNFSKYFVALEHLSQSGLQATTTSRFLTTLGESP
ncbi:TonB-dependent receptor plug domain-containing protein [Hymenobacter crusticola]|uniref:TonB-dependent receptor plug domain-containing protein n=1 Tax=Hymenobacter crusticola TaxID=1770526 RepID=A0A243WL32_9BACT|nr:TonB-dependent receptor plug domain-containing protein [Hymenobacter crusticola]OUJ76279.1 hypothetical protein BXP70_03220 [Hymenobacter crusticola]